MRKDVHRSCSARRQILSLCAIALCAAAASGSSVQSGPSLDLVIRNATVVDGSGRKAFRADIGIGNGVILRLERPGRLRAPEILDASGLIAAPGFIDLHTHADDLAANPLAENFVRMGVTTVVSGNCGGSALLVAEALEKTRAAKPAVNFATLVGHNTIRRAVMGNENRPPSREELDRMKSLVAAAMRDGAFGLSSGLQYVPGTYSATEEIIELAKESAGAGGLYATHMRNEGTEIEKAVAEAIRVGEEAKCPVQISHIKIDSPSRWGMAKKVLAQVEAARRRGTKIGLDQYAYGAGSSGLSIRFPAWVLEGGQALIRQRLEDEATWDRVRTEMKAMLAERGFKDLSWAVVASYRPDPTLNGLSIRDIAARRKGNESPEAQLEVAREMMIAGGAQMVYHFMSEGDITAFMRDPNVSVASDSGVLRLGEGAPHPRGYGNNARVLGHYVREKRIVSLEEAVRKMTSLPAAQFGIRARGMIREGYAADIVLFDRKAVADRGTYAEPHRYATGIPHVFVNGVPVIRDGADTGARPGQVLTRGDQATAGNPAG